MGVRLQYMQRNTRYADGFLEKRHHAHERERYIGHMHTDAWDCTILYVWLGAVGTAGDESTGVWRLQEAREPDCSARGKLYLWCSDISDEHPQHTACVFLPFIVLHKLFQEKGNR